MNTTDTERREAIEWLEADIIVGEKLAAKCRDKGNAFQLPKVEEAIAYSRSKLAELRATEAGR